MKRKEMLSGLQFVAGAAILTAGYFVARMATRESLRPCNTDLACTDQAGRCLTGTSSGTNTGNCITGGSLPYGADGVFPASSAKECLHHSVYNIFCPDPKDCQYPDIAERGIAQDPASVPYCPLINQQ